MNYIAIHPSNIYTCKIYCDIDRYRILRNIAKYITKLYCNKIAIITGQVNYCDTNNIGPTPVTGQVNYCDSNNIGPTPGYEQHRARNCYFQWRKQFQYIVSI